MTAAAEPQAAPDPLAMARNAVRAVRDMSDLQHSDPAQAAVLGAGKVGFDSAVVGACMALISIAADMRELRVLPAAVGELRAHVAALRGELAAAADALGRAAVALEEGGLG